MLRTDLKIFKSERMTQQADAGGQRTSNEVLNGQLNDVFGNISDIDHAQSAVDIAKVYPVVATNDTQQLQDGHLLINEPPLDPLVDVMIIESAKVNDGSTRADIIEAIESSVIPSLLLRSGLSEMVEGQDQLNALDLAVGAAGTGEQPTITLRIGGIYVIGVEYTGGEQPEWPLFQHFIKVTAIDTTSIRFEPPLPHPAPGRNRLVNGQSRCTVLRDVTTGAGVKYHGVTQLTADAAGTTLQVEYTTGRVTPRITEATERLANIPFAATETGLIKKQVDIPAVGVTYSIPVADFIELPGYNAFEVLYISAGTSYRQTYSNAALNSGQFEFAIQRTPDAGTIVKALYYSSNRYGFYTYPDAIPGGFTLLPATIRGSVLRAADDKRYGLTQDETDPNRFTVWINNATTNLIQLAVIINPENGTPTYFNGYSDLQYDAVLEDDTATGESATAAEFVIPFDEVLPATFYLSVELVAGGLLSASCDTAGDITGVNVTGTLAGNVVSLAFAQPVKLSTLQYSVNEVVELVPPTNLYGINPLRLPNGGKVPLYRPFGVVCVSNTIYQDAESLPAAQVINARPNSFIDIVDSTGASLWHPLNTHYEYDKTTGEVTIVDASGYTAPFELVDTLSELALVTGVTESTLKITAALQGAFPAGSVVSSVYQLGDLQARVSNLFDQNVWFQWADSLQGEPATASYNSISNPVEVVNESAVNERWALQFTSDSAFRCIGENVGQVGTGDTLNDFAPLNPATGQPYFVIRSAGWGGGWQPGNALRFNTLAASKPAVLLRSVSAGHSAIDQDSIRLFFPGNAQ